MKCPKCNNEMEEGLIVDKTTDLSIPGKQNWGKGIKFVWGIENRKDVITYRCKKCGYLESYAK